MENNCALVVEDYPIIAQAWEGILRKSQHFSDVHIFHDPADLAAKVIDLQPRLILMDINLPGAKNGIDLTRDLMRSNPDLKVIILSMHSEQAFVRNAFSAGALAYVTKTSPTSEIKVAIQTALKNETYLCQELRA